MINDYLNSVKKILDDEKKFLNWKNFNKFRSDVVKSWSQNLSWPLLV